MEALIDEQIISHILKYNKPNNIKSLIQLPEERLILEIQNLTLQKDFEFSHEVDEKDESKGDGSDSFSLPGIDNMYKNNQITKIVDTLLQNSSNHPAVVPFLLVVASIDESNLVFEALKKHYNESKLDTLAEP